MACAAEVSDSTCAVCMESFTDPKFLPCHHTFCATCITDVAHSQPENVFLCPICRSRTSLPPGGVSALQTNFYIQDRVPHQRCGVHKKKELEFFCLECRKPICINCKLTEHAEHKAQDIESTVEEKKKELLVKTSHLQGELEHVKRMLREAAKKKQEVSTQEAEVEKSILGRHAALVTAADKYRDEALASLRTTSQGLERDIAKIRQQCEDTLKTIIHLLQELTELKTRKGTAETLTLADNLKVQCGKAITLPSGMDTLRCIGLSRETGVMNDAMQTMARDFLGTVKPVEHQGVNWGALGKRGGCMGRRGGSGGRGGRGQLWGY